MIRCNIVEMMKIWGELVECFYCVNKYGVDIAEIYSYRLEPYSPSLHKTDNDSEAKTEMWYQVANDLVEILEEFNKVYKCSIFIDDMTFKKWKSSVKNRTLRKIGHRYHITVTHNRE